MARDLSLPRVLPSGTKLRNLYQLNRELELLKKNLRNICLITESDPAIVAPRGPARGYFGIVWPRGGPQPGPSSSFSFSSFTLSYVLYTTFILLRYLSLSWSPGITLGYFLLSSTPITLPIFLKRGIPRKHYNPLIRSNIIIDIFCSTTGPCPTLVFFLYHRLHNLLIKYCHYKTYPVGLSLFLYCQLFSQ